MPALGVVALVVLVLAAAVFAGGRPSDVGRVPSPARSLVPIGSGPMASPAPSSPGPVKPSSSTGPSLSPGPSPTAEPSPAPTASGPLASGLALDPPPTAGPFEMDLYRKGDFVTEKRPIWCAPAALQTMINIMSPGADTTRATQKLLHTITRKLGPSPDRGAEPEGMARTLASLDYGPYRVIAAESRSAAFKAAARAIRLTGRPAALLVWRGAHNWVVSGFRSTADPALGDGFKVTHLWIEDVWYPRISDIWGESRPPDSLVPVRLMPQDYLPWKRPTGRYPGKDGKFVLIIPVAG
ncbi:MAG: hypothetical protein M3P84_04890 [Chloroflexota bacterium]|nr:hypothetical protein [Chloroflexota bacterium]